MALTNKQDPLLRLPGCFRHWCNCVMASHKIPMIGWNICNFTVTAVKFTQHVPPLRAFCMCVCDSDILDTYEQHLCRYPGRMGSDSSQLHNYSRNRQKHKTNHVIHTDPVLILWYNSLTTKQHSTYPNIIKIKHTRHEVLLVVFVTSVVIYWRQNGHCVWDGCLGSSWTSRIICGAEINKWATCRKLNLCWVVFSTHHIQSVYKILP